MKKEQQPQGPKTKNVILTSILILVGLFFLSSILAFFIGASLLIGGENTINGNVAIIEVKGTITGDEQGTFSSVASSSSITKKIEQANNNPAIKAIVIEINSPGGSPVGSAEIADALLNVNKPTVAWIREVGASGGYWIASAADHVIAHELSITGSIGVYGSYLDFSSFLTDHNITYQRLVAGEYKDTGSPLRPLSYSEEQILQAKMEKMKTIFVSAVAQNRNKSYDDIALIADGMYLLGEEALNTGLIDELGGKKEVTAYLEQQNITPTYEYLRESNSFFNMLTTMLTQHGYKIGEGLAYGLQQEQLLART